MLLPSPLPPPLLSPVNLLTDLLGEKRGTRGKRPASNGSACTTAVDIQAMAWKHVGCSPHGSHDLVVIWCPSPHGSHDLVAIWCPSPHGSHDLVAIWCPSPHGSHDQMATHWVTCACAYPGRWPAWLPVVEGQTRTVPLPYLHVMMQQCNYTWLLGGWKVGGEGGGWVRGEMARCSEINGKYLGNACILT